MHSMSFDAQLIAAIELAAKYPSIKRVGIFGSYARNSAEGASDIDLLYDYDETDEQSTDELLEYVENVDKSIKQATHIKKVDYVWLKGVLQSKNANFRNNVLHDVIWIYES